MKKLDFLPNRQNKYSIRKFTVGTASILLGTMMLLGIQDEAKAAETTTSNTAESNDSSSEQGNGVGSDASGEVLDSTKTTQLNQPTESSTDENNGLKQETNAESNDVSTDPQPKIEDTSNVNSSQVEEITLDTAPTNGGSNTTNPTTKESNENSTNDLTKPAPPSPENSTSKQATSESKTPAPAIAPITDGTSKTNSQQAATDKKVDNTQVNTGDSNDTSSNDTKIETDATKPVTTNVKDSTVSNTDNSKSGVETINSTAGANDQLNKNNPTGQIENKITAADSGTAGTNGTNANDSQSNLNTSSGLNSQSSITNTRSKQLKLFNALKQSSDNKDANTVTTTAETASTLRTVSFVAMPNSVTTQAATGGNNVANLVTVTNMNAVPIKNDGTVRTVPYQDTNTTQEELFATSGDVIKFTGDFAIADEVNEGDYITLSYGDYFRPGSIETPPAVTNLVDNSGKLVATGVYDQATNTIKYTFTNYVDQLSNITGSFNFSASPNRYTATTDKTPYPFNVTMAGETYNKNIVVDYGNKNGESKTQTGAKEPSKQNVTAVTAYDTQSQEYKMTAYINQSDLPLNGAKYNVNLTGMTGINDVKIYLVNDESRMVDSFVPDVSGLTPVTKNITYNADKTTMSIDLGNISSTQKYIILYDAVKDNSASNTRRVDNTLTYTANNLNQSDPNNVVLSAYAEKTEASGNLYSLGDYVWFDSNNNGLQDSGEIPASNVTVYLYDSNNIRQTTTTDSNGHYQFDGLQNGTYTVEFVPPNGYTATISNVNNNANDDKDSDGLKVTATINGADNFTYDLGLVMIPKTYTLGDYVWEDTNKDGIQNNGESGIEGVTVTLTKPDGTTETTKTDAEGRYEFTGLENGDYTVKFETPAGYEPTKVNNGDDTLDSDGTTVTATINNADNPTIDSGFYKPVKVPATYTLGDYVWEDTNKDGIQNSNEPGIAGVTVTLTKPDGTTETTTTDADGYYKFTGLENGDYTVTFTTPEGYEPTVSNNGDDALDSDGTTVTATINNADNPTIDSGFYKPVTEPPKEPATYTLGDKVWEDTNKDGIQNSNESGIEGVKVTLTKPDGTTETTTTDAEGHYEFTGLENGDYTVTFETPEGYEPTVSNNGDDRLDSDGTTVTATINNADNPTIDSGFYKPVTEPEQTPATYTLGDKVWEDTNHDGIQNSNEPGIEGVKVTLTKPDGTTETTTTDKDGHYEFTNLPNGDYTVTFETPEGYEPTVTNNGDDALDSDGSTVTVTINNADNPTIDSGFYKPVTEPEQTPATYTLGDKVWEDTNHDGIQNSNEPGIEGVKVTLTKPDGTTETTTTDKDGHYEFTDLPNGDYTVTFETPEGYEPTVPNNGDDRQDSDGTTVKVTINNADNPTIDSGFFKPVTEPEQTPATYTLGDKVWEDTNHDGIQNSNEPGIEGVKVTLTKPDGTTETTTTDKDGHYEFKDLPNGDYTVTFETPEGYEPTVPNNGDDRQDSDGTTVKVTINNADNPTIDSGFHKVPEETTPPENPNNPDEPSNPENPNNPDEPSNPENPNNPDEPSNPENPNNPDEPSNPENPNNPDEPSNPENPNNPDEPNNPENPNNPDEPNNPENPNNPDEPSNPENPNNPDEPNNPEKPGQPNNPNEPSNPGTPDQPNHLTSGYSNSFVTVSAPVQGSTDHLTSHNMNGGEKALNSSDNEKGNKEEALPETGSNEANGTLFGSLIAGLGALFLLGRKRRKEDRK
ncbi:SdrD B-like domain-containing protein [Staphylococcus condimenti]|nr:SdrD B-like domain-containing protein [Staphylococcus condimenti]MDK8646028.1 SdrD B-like domain-containing protein [Staphylococcus condimenti]